MRLRRIAPWLVLAAAVAAPSPAAAALSFTRIDYPATIPSGPGNTAAGAVCDIDRDGLPDVLARNFGAGGGAAGDVVLLRHGPGATLLAPVEVLAGTEGTSVGCVDVDGDGRRDIAATFGFGSDLFAVRFAGPSGLGPRVSYPATLSGSTAFATYGFAVADFDHDGRPDIATVSRLSSASLRMLRGNPARTADPASFLMPAVPFGPGGNRTFALTADFDGDHLPDLVESNLDGGTVSVYAGGGNTSSSDVNAWFSAHLDVPVAASPTSIAVGDLNGDARPDLAVASNDTQMITLLLNTGVTDGAGNVIWARRDRAAIGPVGDPLNGPVAAVAMADLNGDGRADVILDDAGQDDVRVMLGNGSTSTFVDPPLSIPMPVGSHPEGVSVGDIDGDGRPDIVVGDRATGQISTLLNRNAWPAPTIVTGRAAAVGSRTVQLQGSLATHGLPVRYGFEYGTTSSLGRRTALAGPVAFTALHGVAQNVTGLVPATKYFYRLLLSGAATGTRAGSIATFRTAPARARVTKSRFRARWRASRVRGTLDVSGNVSYPARIRIELRRGRRTVARSALFTVRGTNWKRSLRLPARLVPGLYQVRVTGSAGGGAITPGVATSRLAQPPEGVVDRAWMTALRRGSPTGFVTGSQTTFWAYFHLAAPARSRRLYTAPCRGPRGLRATTAGKFPTSLLEFRYSAKASFFAFGTWRCTLMWRGRPVATTQLGIRRAR